METLHQLSQRQPHIVKRLRSAVQRLQAVHQHDLAVETQEVVAVKVLHHMLTVVAKALLQHGEVAAFVSLRQLAAFRLVRQRPGKELQRGRARHLARQHKAPRLDKVQPFGFAAVQIVGPGGGDGGQPVFIGGRKGIERRAEFAPGLRPLGAIALQQPDHLPRPVEIVLRQHRQIEQPFAGIVNDLQIERRALFEVTQQRILRAVAQRQPHFANAARWRRPGGRRAVELRQPFVVGEARRTHIALRNALDAQQAFVAHHGKERQPRAAVHVKQLVD